MTRADGQTRTADRRFTNSLPAVPGRAGSCLCSRIRVSTSPSVSAGVGRLGSELGSRSAADGPNLDSRGSRVMDGVEDADRS
jgi:hypothetical protein